MTSGAILRAVQGELHQKEFHLFWSKIGGTHDINFTYPTHSCKMRKIGNMNVEVWDGLGKTIHPQENEHAVIMYVVFGISTSFI